MEDTHLSWPELSELENGYADEFGMIQIDVYQVAGELWSRASRLSCEQLGDSATGQHLLLKAAAQVSRHLHDTSEPIHDLKAYLWRSFERLVFNERKKFHRQHNADENLDTLPDERVDKVEDRIFWDEILQQMDSQTRRLFRLRMLGYSYDEISLLLGKRSNVLRSQLNKAIKKIRKHLNR